MVDFTDEEAPYGINPSTGKPYTMSAENRAARGAMLAEARRAAMAAGGKPKRARRKTSTRSTAAKGTPTAPPRKDEPNAPPEMTQSTADREAGLIGINALAVAVLATIGKAYPAVQIDAITLAWHGPQLAHGVAVAADHNDKLGAAVDFLTKQTPYMPLITAGVGLVAQIAVNHGFMRPMKELGTVTPEDMARQFAERYVQAEE
jgi:hypothetical protein